MAKLLLVLFLAGCIFNISYSLIIPKTSDLDADHPTLPEDDKVLELIQKYDSDSATELFDERKKVAKRQAAPDTTSSVTTVSVGSTTSSPSGSETPPTNSTVAPGAAGNFQMTVNTIVNVTNTVTRVVEQIGNFSEIIFAIFQTFGRFGRAAVDVKDPADAVELIPDITAREKSDTLLRNPLDGIFGQLGGNGLDDDAELVPKGELERQKKVANRTDDTTDITTPEPTRPGTSLEPTESPTSAASIPRSNTPIAPASAQALDSNIIKVIDNLSNNMGALGSFTNILAGNSQYIQGNPNPLDINDTTREKRDILINLTNPVDYVINLLENFERKRRDAQFVEEGNALLTQSKVTLPDILSGTDSAVTAFLGNIQTIARHVKESSFNDRDLSSVERDTLLEVNRVKRGAILDFISGIRNTFVEFYENLITGIYAAYGIGRTALQSILPSRSARSVNAFGDTSLEVTRVKRGTILDFISGIRNNIAGFIGNIVTGISGVYGIVRTVLQAIFPSRTTRSANSFGELLARLKRQLNNSQTGGGIENYFEKLEDRLRNSFRTFENSFQ